MTRVRRELRTNLKKGGKCVKEIDRVEIYQVRPRAVETAGVDASCSGTLRGALL